MKEREEYISEIISQMKLAYLELKMLYAEQGKELTIKEMFELLPNEKPLTITKE